MDAVVMAAGEGRRLRPVTERWAKPVLPIDGRPVLATLLRELAAAGLEDVWVVVGHLAGQIEALVGDGSAFGVRVRYARQPRALGSADAVARAIAAGATPPLLVSAADTVFAPGTIRMARDCWLESEAAGALAVRNVPPGEVPERSAVTVERGRLLSVVEKPPPGTAGTLAGAPLWLLGPDLCVGLEGLPGPPFELAVAAQRAIDAGRELGAIEIGPTRDITRPADVLARNFAYLSSLGGADE
ncbi:MAG: sugar phosphate nucleotidyltransferase [Actinomycetota bacterium]|nr:sugar phosphate nucleotidyltransferase [Actinomycetota bacterium]